MDKLGKESPTNYEQLIKRSRPNKTTPPSLNATFTKEPGPTPVHSTSSRPLWVHSPEDRRVQIMHIFDESTQDLNEDILTMNQKMQTLSAQMSTCLTNQQQIKQDNLELKTQNRTLKDENIELRKQITLLDIASRKNNIKMWGIFEAQNENKFDCNRKIITIFQRIGISLHPQSISQAHRLGPKTRNKVPRVMLVTFINTDDKDFVLNKAKVLSMHFRIRIESDLPQAMEDQRNELRQIVVAANKMKDEKGNNKYRASLQQDTLVVNNRTYDVNSAKHLPRGNNCVFSNFGTFPPKVC